METREKCKICNKSAGSDWLSCEICDGWFHTSCVKVNEAAYKVLKELENCHWFCQPCNSKMGKVIPNIVKVSERVTEMDGRVEKLEKELKIHYGRQTKLEAKQEIHDQEIKAVQAKCDVVKKEMDKVIEKTCNEVQTMKSHNAKLAEDFNKMKIEIDKQFGTISEELTDVRSKMADTKSDMFKFVDEKFSGDHDDGNDNTWVKVAEKHVDAKLGQVATEVQTMQKALQDTRDAAREEQDKEARRNNIIMYRVPESDAPLAAERNHADKRFCEQLLFSLNVGIADEDVRKVVRLGRRGIGAASSRPILIQLGSHNVKNLVMENLYKLKSLPERFKSVVIAHDMTKRERDECKTLVESAKLKNANEAGEWVYRVRGPPGRMKIVQFRKTQ